MDQKDQTLQKRENFAISLRKQKKDEILKFKRKKNLDFYQLRTGNTSSKCDFGAFVGNYNFETFNDGVKGGMANHMLVSILLQMSESQPKEESLRGNFYKEMVKSGAM